MAELFCSDDISQWRASLASYHRVLAQKEAEKTGKKPKSKEDGLLQLDKWYQETLPGLISSRENPHLKHPELCRLMKWKLTRGKFRPRLSELVQQNSSDEVEKVTREALQMVPTDLAAAVKHLCQLKAVGPATASAILCAGSPSLAPFMADEAVLSVPGLGKLDYTLKHYMAYASKLQDKVKQLNVLEVKVQAKPWTCHDAELALWTFHLAEKFGLETVPKDEAAVPSKEVKNGEGVSEDGAEPKTKRMKLGQESHGTGTEAT